MASILVDKRTLSAMLLHEDSLPPLADNAVRLRVDGFSITANNVTYAALGDEFGYWNFFPAGDGMGIVPVWGHATVEASNHADIQAGERVYGFMPMRTHLDVVPGRVGAGGFTDLAAHRQTTHAFYNVYSRLAHDPEHDPAHEAERMIFGPLFKTGFLIEAMFRREGWFGARTLMMTSASSKTAMALASVAKDLSPAITRIGLTSARHVAFVESTGLYDRVVAYDDIASLPQAESVCVDFSGNERLLLSIHQRLGDTLKYSCLVGATHIAEFGGEKSGAMPGPAPIVFFAPAHAATVVQEMGTKRFAEAVGASWHRFLQRVGSTVAVEEKRGLAAAADTYLALLKGEADPGVAVIVRP